MRDSPDGGVSKVGRNERTGWKRSPNSGLDQRKIAKPRRLISDGIKVEVSAPDASQRLCDGPNHARQFGDRGKFGEPSFVEWARDCRIQHLFVCRTAPPPARRAAGSK
jgi:hypothetical protein